MDPTNVGQPVASSILDPFLSVVISYILISWIYQPATVANETLYRHLRTKNINNFGGHEHPGEGGNRPKLTSFDRISNQNA